MVSLGHPWLCGTVSTENKINRDTKSVEFLFEIANVCRILNILWSHSFLRDRKQGVDRSSGNYYLNNLISHLKRLFCFPNLKFGAFVLSLL